MVEIGVDTCHVEAYGHGRWKPSFASRFDLAYGAVYALALYRLRDAPVERSRRACLKRLIRTAVAGDADDRE